MIASNPLENPLFARNRYDVFVLVKDLYHGEATGWYAMAVIVGCITFFVLYEKVTGKPFVKSRKERRRARNRRKVVLWEYERGE